MSRIMQRGTVGGLLCVAYKSIKPWRERGERREKNPLERLVTNKGGRGSPLSGDQPRT